MRIYREKNYEALSRRAANLISAEIIRKPDCVLGLATGGTPLGTYSQLIAWCKKGDLSFREVKTVNLDEYRGLAPEHPQSYRRFMQERLFDHIDIKRENTFIPNGLAGDTDAECAGYDALVRSLGYADLQLLGLGRNGHIGFNEPSDYFYRKTHLVELTQSTIEANARFFGSDEPVPREAITIGMGSIMAARRILLVVSGANKAEALRDAFSGDITPRCPASILQLHHDVVLVGDEEALSLLGDEPQSLF